MNERHAFYTGQGPFRSVALIGLGVMGGSLARALRDVAEPPEIVAFSPDPREGEAALAAGAVDRVSGSSEVAVGTAELVVYATPLEATRELMTAHQAFWQPGAVITDVCSLKAPLALRAEELGMEHRYVGSHPMAGSEGSGFGASRGDLYQGCKVWLCGAWAPIEVQARVRLFWLALGAETEWTEPVHHDLVMMLVSHLPQLLSNVLARKLDEAGLTPEDLGPGGRDMTRLAGSSPEIWRDVLKSVAPRLADELWDVGARLGELSKALRAEDLDRVVGLMEDTRAWVKGPNDQEAAGEGVGRGGQERDGAAGGESDRGAARERDEGDEGVPGEIAGGAEGEAGAESDQGGAAGTGGYRRLGGPGGYGWPGEGSDT